MGFAARTAEIHATLSRHNSPQDAEHDALWAEARRRIALVVDDPKFGPILLDASGLDSEP